MSSLAQIKEPFGDQGSCPYRNKIGQQMSAFALYTVGTIVLLGSVIYGHVLFDIPQTWIGAGELVLIGLAVMSAVMVTKARELPKYPDA